MCNFHSIDLGDWYKTNYMNTQGFAWDGTIQKWL